MSKEHPGSPLRLTDQVVSVDVFDKPETLLKVWDRLISGLAMELPDTERRASHADILTRLYGVRRLNFQPVQQVGLGEAYQCRGADGVLGAALVVHGVPVHLSVSFPGAKECLTDSGV